MGNGSFFLPTALELSAPEFAKRCGELQLNACALPLPNCRSVAESCS